MNQTIFADLLMCVLKLSLRVPPQFVLRLFDGEWTRCLKVKQTSTLSHTHP